jgi:glycine hydroxymethyltransferase
MVPFDDKSPFVTSGIRIGTAAITSRGMKEKHMDKIVDLIDQVLMNPEDQKIIKSVKSEVNVWMKKFPLYTK